MIGDSLEFGGPRVDDYSGFLRVRFFTGERPMEGVGVGGAGVI